jgi:hypothetical protein
MPVVPSRQNTPQETTLTLTLILDLDPNLYHAILLVITSKPRLLISYVEYNKHSTLLRLRGNDTTMLQQQQRILK